MTATKIYTREDVRDVWRQYQRGDTAAGNDFALIANAQSKTFQALKAEIVSRSAVKKIPSQFPLVERQPSSANEPE